MSSDYIYLSAEGMANLKAELHELRSVQRPRVVDDIRRAREHGDLSENAEYHAAKEAQTHIERKIAELEFELSKSQVVKDVDFDPDTAVLLSSVKVKDLEDGEEMVFHLVSQPEANVMKNKISVDSPVGRAMIGRKSGETVTVVTPGGKIEYKILEILPTA